MYTILRFMAPTAQNRSNMKSLVVSKVNVDEFTHRAGLELFHGEKDSTPNVKYQNVQ